MDDENNIGKWHRLSITERHNKKSAETSSKERIRKALERQKDDRFQAQMLARRAAQVAQEEEKRRHSVTAVQVRNRPEYSHQLMLPELLEELPFDLSQPWLGCCIPVIINMQLPSDSSQDLQPHPSLSAFVNNRCIVVASMGKTMAWRNNGDLLMHFQSNLPGGQVSTSKKYTILDCLFDPQSFTFHVLDALCWNTTLLFSCDAEFRNFWLINKLAELPYPLSGKFTPQANTSSTIHQDKSILDTFMTYDMPVTFHILKRFSCTSHDTLSKTLIACPNTEAILFYHKEGMYDSGSVSPLFQYLPVSCLQSMQHAATTDHDMEGIQ